MKNQSYIHSVLLLKIEYKYEKLVILGITIYSFAQLTNAATLNVKPYGTTQDGQKLNSIP